MTRKRRTTRRSKAALSAEEARLRALYVKGELDPSPLFDDKGLDKLLEKVLGPVDEDPDPDRK